MVNFKSRTDYFAKIHFFVSHATWGKNQEILEEKTIVARKNIMKARQLGTKSYSIEDDPSNGHMIYYLI